MDFDQQSFEEVIGNYFCHKANKIQVNEKFDMKNIKVKVKDAPPHNVNHENKVDVLNIEDSYGSDLPRKRARKSQSILLESGFHDFLPKGWKKEVLQRTTGQTAGKIDVFFYSPTGKRLRSKVEIADYAEKNKLSLDIEAFSFTRTKKVNSDGSTGYLGLGSSNNSYDTQNPCDLLMDEDSGHMKITSNFKNDKENDRQATPEHIVSFASEGFPDASLDYPVEFSDRVFKIEKHISFSAF